MGLFSRMFGNAKSDLDRAEVFLENAEPSKALKLALRARDGGGGEFRSRADVLIVQARTAMVEVAVEKADRCEATHPQDATDWLEMAIEDARALAEDQVAGAEDTVRSLTERRAALLGEMKRRDAEEFAEDMMERMAAVDDAPEDDGFEPETIGYEILIGTMRDDLRDAYETKPEAFRDAVVALSEGDAEAALESLATLDAADDHVQFERGRARMLAGDHAGALADFEAIWPAFGDEPLDHQGMSSLPLLWAHAGMASGIHSVVADRLAEVGSPTEVGVGVTDLRAQALVVAGRMDEARTLLGEAVLAFPKAQSLRYLLAGALAKGGFDPAGAVSVLDAAVAACCSGGSCASQPLHVPSLELLATLLLADSESEPQRIMDTINMAIHARGGITTSIARLQEGYFRRIGEEAQAEISAEVAEQLAEAGASGEPALLAPTMGGESGAVL